MKYKHNLFLSVLYAGVVSAGSLVVAFMMAPLNVISAGKLGGYSSGEKEGHSWRNALTGHYPKLKGDREDLGSYGFQEIDAPKDIYYVLEGSGWDPDPTKPLTEHPVIEKIVKLQLVLEQCGINYPFPFFESVKYDVWSKEISTPNRITGAKVEPILANIKRDHPHVTDPGGVEREKVLFVDEINIHSNYRDAASNSVKLKTTLVSSYARGKKKSYIAHELGHRWVDYLSWEEHHIESSNFKFYGWAPKGSHLYREYEEKGNSFAGVFLNVSNFLNKPQCEAYRERIVYLNNR